MNPNIYTKPSTWLWIFTGSLLFLVVTLGFRNFPVAPAYLLSLSFAYLLLLIWHPYTWLIALPLLTVSVDLTLESGRFLFNEFDLFFYTTISAQCLLRAFPVGINKAGFLLLVGLMALTLFNGGNDWLHEIATLQHSSGQNPYYSNLYAYKIFKGVLWGGSLSAFFLYLYQIDKRKTSAYFLTGIIISSFAFFLTILWERGTLHNITHLSEWWVIAQSLLDFGSSYRTTGIFSDMHTGGEVVDGVILLFLPVLLFGLLKQKYDALRILSLLGILSLTYITLVGFTRATYVSFAFCVLLFGLDYYFGHYRQHHLTHSNDQPPLPLSRSLIVQQLLLVIMGVSVAHLAGLAYGMSALLCLTIVAFLAAGVVNAYPVVTLLVSSCLAIPSILVLIDALLSNRWKLATLQGLVSLVFFSACFYALSLVVFRQQTHHAILKRTINAVILISLIAVGTIIIDGYQINERLKHIQTDLQTRLDHWQQVIDSGSTQPLSLLSGNGTGAFPRNNIFNSPQQLDETGSFNIEQNTLSLTKGDSFYFGQRLTLTNDSLYQLELTLAQPFEGIAVFSICRRNVIFASNFHPNCAFHKAKLNSSNSHTSYAASLDLSRFLDNQNTKYWPIFFGIQNAQKDSTLSISTISLKPFNQEVELLKNGHFTQGLDYWFFIEDFNHLPWHIKNTFVQLFYDWGILGSLLFAGLFIVASRQWYCNQLKHPITTAFLLGIISLLLFGLFGTPLDSARVSWLFFLYLGFLALFNKALYPPRVQHLN